MKHQLPTTVSRRYATLAGISLGFVWLYLAFKTHLRMPTRVDWNIYSNLSEYTSAKQSNTYTNTDIFDFRPVDSSAIKSVCEDAIWNSTLVFTCNNSVGGIGNIRNSILNCVRYAISAGAALVMPQIIVRSSSDITRIQTGDRT